MQFRSPTGTPIRVANVFGHCAIVGDEWRELPPILHRDAMAAGCECNQGIVQTAAPKPESSPDSKHIAVDEATVIREAIELMLKRDEKGDFTADGSPNAKVVSHLAGMNVGKAPVMQVWVAMQNEAAASGAE